VTRLPISTPNPHWSTSVAVFPHPANGAAALVAALALVVVVPAVPVWAGRPIPAPCVVTNTTVEPDVTYASLQEAVDAATSGDRLTVRNVCVGITTVDRDLAIVGVRQKRHLRPTLDGDAGGPVVTVAADATVMIRSLRITDGSGEPCGSDCTTGGGVANHGTVTLDGVVVTGNTARDGGGIHNDRGTLTLMGSTSVRHNTVGEGTGGGIFSTGTLVLAGSASVVGNVAAAGGGIFSTGTTVLTGTSSVHHNTARRAGGIYNHLGRLTLTGYASVHHNTATANGSGIYAAGPTTLSGHASVHHNTSDTGSASGAIEIPALGQAFTMKRHSSVTANSGGPGGGGVVVWPSCGATATITGVRPRTSGNTPGQVVAATGFPACG